MALQTPDAAPVPLFTELSQSVESAFFWVTSGAAVAAMAFNFACDAARADNSERRVPQVACLQRVLFKQVKTGFPDELPDAPCVKLYDLRKFKAEILAIDDVRLDNCCMCLSARSNLLLIDIPGAYRFVFNDASAVGTARIFLQAYKLSDLRADSPFFMGAR